MPLRSGGALDNEYARGRLCRGLISMGKQILPNLYAGLYDTTENLVKIDLETFSVVSSLTAQKIESLESHEDFLYAGDVFNHIYKVDIPSFSLVGTITFPAGEGDFRDLLVVDNFLYATVYTSPKPKVSKVDLTTFTRVGVLTLPSLMWGAKSLAVLGNFLYLGSSSRPCRIDKIDLTTFTRVASLTLATGENDMSGACMVVDGNFLYVGTAVSPGEVVKVDLTTFTRIGAIASLPGVRSLAVVDGFLYVGCYESIVKINLADFSVVSTLPIATGNYMEDLAVVGETLYAGHGYSPGAVSKIALVDFTLVSTLTLAKNWVYALALG